MKGCHDQMMSSHLDEFMWRERHGRTASAALRSLCRDIALRYPVWLAPRPWLLLSRFFKLPTSIILAFILSTCWITWHCHVWDTPTSWLADLTRLHDERIPEVEYSIFQYFWVSKRSGPSTIVDPRELPVPWSTAPIRDILSGQLQLTRGGEVGVSSTTLDSYRRTVQSSFRGARPLKCMGCKPAIPSKIPN